LDNKTGEHYHQIVGEIQAGNCFGELALVKDITRTATVVCKGDSEFLRLDRCDFDNVLRRSMEIEWNSRLSQMQQIPYFCSWPMKEIKEINIHAQIKPYKVDQVVIGNRDRYDLPEHVYFIVKGRCNIVRRIAMVEVSRLVGNHGSTKRVLKYRRLAANRVKQLVGNVGDNGTQALDKLNNALQGSSAFDNGQSKTNIIKSRIQRDTADRCPTKGGYRQCLEPYSSQLRLLDNDYEHIKYNNGVLPQLMRDKGRHSHNVIRHTKPIMRHGFNPSLGRMSMIKEGGGRAVKQKPQSNQTETRVIFKYLVVGRLEVGDSFGYGENLRNIFITTAAPTEFLTVPGHIMMRAERHIETFNRTSKMPNFGILNNVKTEGVRPDMKTNAEKHKETQNKLREGRSKRKTHPYEELRHIIEERIPNERESYDRWRQSEDWSAYKGSVLDDVINDRQKQ